MLKQFLTNQFQKDLKKYKRKKQVIEKLKNIINLLTNEEKLPKKHREHKLKGNYKDRSECHIEPDILLIYIINDDNIIFERIGSHSELFK